MPLSEKMKRDVVDVKREQESHQSPRNQSDGGATLLSSKESDCPRTESLL